MSRIGSRGSGRSCRVLYSLGLAIAFSAPVAAAEPTPDATDALLRGLLERVEELERQVAVLTQGTDNGCMPAKGEPSLSIARASTHQPAAAGLGASNRVDGGTSQTTQEASTHRAEADAEPITADERNALLPSRGWRSGMHYGSERKVEVHGLIDLEYADPGDSGSGVSSFDLHHANIFVLSQLRPDLRGYAEFEFEHSGDEVEVDQAYLSWAPAEVLTLNAGRFYAPFGIERFVWYPATNALISRPAPMHDIVPGNFYANGLMASGIVDAENRNRFTYELSVANGLGDGADVARRASRQTRDNNSDKAVSARLAYVFWPNLEIGTSYHTQEYSTTGDLGLTFRGVDLTARYSGFELRTEWIDADVDRQTPVAEAAPSLRQRGWYAQLGYTLNTSREVLPSMLFAARLDDVDLDRETNGSDDRRYFSLGLNALILDHYRAKLEYRWVTEKETSSNDDQLLAQFVVDF